MSEALRLRKSTGTFDVSVLTSVDEIEPETWDALSGDRFFASHRWYRFGEKVCPENEARYVILSHAGQPVARATFWVVHYEPIPVSSRFGRGLICAVLRRWPLLVCRSPLSSYSGLILPDSPLRQSALDTIIDVAHELTRQHSASFIVFDYLCSQSRDLTWPTGYTVIDGLSPGMSLNIAWPDMEQYVRAQRKSMRKDYRRHMNRAADLNVEINYDDLRPDEHPRAIQLVRAVEAHHNTPPNKLVEPTMRHFHEVETTWITARIDGALVGCGLLVGEGPIRFLTLLGLDYEVRYVYFQLVYGAIRRSIESGVTMLRGGSGAYELKGRLGFEVEEDNHLVFRANNPVLRWVANRLSNYLDSSTDEG